MSRLLGTRLRRNSLYSLLGFLVPSILLIAFTPLLIREMGTTGFGLWSISLAAFGLVGALELGLGTAIAKFVAEYHAAGDLGAVSTIVTLGFAFFAVGAIVLTVPLYLSAGSVAHLFHTEGVPTSEVAHVVRLVSLGLLPLLFMSGGLAIAVGLQRYEIPMTAALAQNGLTIVVAAIVVSLGGSVADAVLGALCLLSAIALVSVVVGVRLLRGLGAQPVFRRGYARTMLTYVVFTGLSSIGAVFFASADRVAVGAVLGLRAVTYYTVAISVANKLLAFADVTTRPLMPWSSSIFASGERQRVRRQLRSATAGVAGVTLAAAAVLLVLAGPLITAWLGASVAEHVITPFRILVVVYAALAIASPAYQVANGIGQAWICAVCAVAGGVATIVLIVPLGREWGVVGAAWANAAYWVALVIPFWVLGTLGPRRLPAGVAAANRR
jgi:O-antigen/teichoic acid export membrane protein